MSKSLGNVVDPLDVIHGVSLQVKSTATSPIYLIINGIDSLQELEEQLDKNRQSGHLSPEEFQRAVDEKRARFPDGIPQIGADALRFTLCSYNVKSNRYTFLFITIIFL